MSIEHIVKKNGIPWSAMSTAIGIMLMMTATVWWVYPAALILALLQKRWIRIGRLHVFNPSNFAVVVTITLLPHKAHIVVGQLGNAYWVGIMVLFLALAVLYRVHRWIIPIVFFTFYAAMYYWWLIPLEITMRFEDVLTAWSSVSFLVFSLFMLTDPVTTPRSSFGQVLFASCVATVAVFTDVLWGIRTVHLFEALFITSALATIVRPGLARRERLKAIAISIGAIIVIMTLEFQSPYYFAMDG